MTPNWSPPVGPRILPQWAHKWSKIATKKPQYVWVLLQRCIIFVQNARREKIRECNQNWTISRLFFDEICWSKNGIRTEGKKFRGFAPGEPIWTHLSRFRKKIDFGGHELESNWAALPPLWFPSCSFECWAWLASLLDNLKSKSGD